MPSVADLVEEPELRRLATPESYDEGLVLADEGKVQVGAFGPLQVSAEVDDVETRQVELRSTKAGLEWACTCPDGRRGAFCSHAVAAAIETWRRSPVRRT